MFCVRYYLKCEFGIVPIDVRLYVCILQLEAVKPEPGS
jgi:hypothetical protein